MTLTLPFTSESPRILLAGIDCNFTRQVLNGLVAGGLTIGGMILPGPPGIDAPMPVRYARSSLPLAGAGSSVGSIVEFLRTHDVPAFRFGSLQSNEALQTIRSFSADVLICACFPQLIPRIVTDLFPRKAINIHPSLLPDKRGPDPLFWTFREGTGRSGITLHDLSARFDAGTILSQHLFTYTEGVTERELEQSLASIATQQLLQLLATRLEQAPRTPQDDSNATYAPLPATSDFRVDPDMTARSAFNFVRGVQGRGVPIVVTHGNTDVEIVEAITFAIDRTSQGIGTTALEFADGYLIARVRPVIDSC